MCSSRFGMNRNTVRTISEEVMDEAIIPDEGVGSGYSERKLTFVDMKRKYIFTCCDYEPAVLARNGFLLTLVAGKCTCKEEITHDARDIWNLFYHLFVPERAVVILREHATCLLRASESLELWKSSPFGKFIGFLSKHSLEQIRSFWVSYATIHDRDQFEENARSVIRRRSKDIGDSRVIHGVRAAGPFWITAIETMADAYRAYWKTGVVGGNPSDIADLGNSDRGLVNPMFAVSSAHSGDYAVHYGTEPLLGFHLAQTFADTPEGTTTATDAVVKIAKAELRAWCSSFKDYVRNDRVRLNFFSGEAIALCHELQLHVDMHDQLSGSARAYVKPWSSQPLLLDGTSGLMNSANGLSLPFDIIDTSNLSDHVGLINILTATTPLLRKSPFSVLYSESLLVASKSIDTSLFDVLGSDVATFCLLVGVTPVGLLSGVTMEAVSNEMAMSIMHGSNAGGQQQYRLRVPWKFPESTDTTTIKSAHDFTLPILEVDYEPQDLVEYMFSLYIKMFAHDDPSNLFARMQRMNISTQYSTDMQRYTRAALVALLRVAKTRVSTDWDKFMYLFYSKVENDRTLLVGSNSMQELLLHIHYSGLWTPPILQRGPKQVQIPGLSLRSASGETGLLAENDIPAVVSVILVVPRKSLEVFTSENPDTIGSPALHISITQAAAKFAYENIFSSISCSFGKVVPRNNTASGYIIEEDDHGWRGSADLIVTCQVPAFGLLTGPKDGIRVALCVKTAPDTAMKYASKLGMRLSVFETKLGDTSKVYVCRSSPGLDNQDTITIYRGWMDTHPKHNKPVSRSKVIMDGNHKATHLQQHIDFPPPKSAGKALSEGKSVNILEKSPSTVTLQIGEHVPRLIYYPMHINGSQSKLRVARKSSWVEVSLPIRTAPTPEPFDSWTQLLFGKGQSPFLWSIPKVNLTLQPRISLKPKEAADPSWIRTFLAPILSDREQTLSSSADKSKYTTKLHLKESLSTMFGTFAELNPDAAKSTRQVFQLVVGTSCHTIIFVNALRHDLDLGSIVLDTCVVPLTYDMMPDLYTALANMQKKNPRGIVLSEEESILWKRLIPALVERCRTWTHKTTCEYQEMGRVAPLSTDEYETPLCSCGQGKNLPNDFTKRESGEWAPFAKYATRMAIAPIFSVPYVEPSMSEFRKGLASMRAAGSNVGVESSSTRGGATSTTRAQSSAASSTSTSQEQCDTCGSTKGPFKKCARCGKTRYCNQSCQKAAWKAHKKDCG